MGLVVGQESAAKGSKKGAGRAGDDGQRPVGKGSGRGGRGTGGKGGGSGRPEGRGVGHGPGLPAAAPVSALPSKAAPKQRKCRGFSSLVEVKPLVLSESRYVPASIAERDVVGVEKLVRDCKAILNKLHPDKFAKYVDQFLELQVASRDDMAGIVDLIFDQALAEPLFGATYATLCSRCAETFPEFADQADPSRKPHTFQLLLLRKCQEEFKMKHVVAARLSALPAGTTEEKRNWIRGEAKKRKLGSMQFFGELYKEKMLPEKLLHECAMDLLGEIDHPDEDKVVCLCKLMTSVGQCLDHPSAPVDMDEYFARMKAMSGDTSLPTYVRYKLQATLNLRRDGWQATKEQWQYREEAAETAARQAVLRKKMLASSCKGGGGGQGSEKEGKCVGDGWNSGGGAGPSAAVGPAAELAPVAADRDRHESLSRPTDEQPLAKGGGKGSGRGGSAGGNDGGSGPPEGRGRGGSAGPVPFVAPTSLSKAALEPKLEQALEETWGEIKNLVLGINKLGTGDDEPHLITGPPSYSVRE